MKQDMKTISDIDKQIAELRELKKEIARTEFNSTLEEGLKKFKNDGSFRIIDVRLLGSAFCDSGLDQYGDRSTGNIDMFERYRNMCYRLHNAIYDLENFYGSGKHVPIIQAMIDNPTQNNKKNLVKIFRKALQSAEK
jgi:hypothetical protein